MVANPELVKRMKVPLKNVMTIDRLHMIVDELISDMKKTDPKSAEFKELLQKWRQVQFELQQLWSFKVDQGKWCEYRLPHCSCPKLDNDDMGYHMYFSGDCPVHADLDLSSWSKEE